MDLQTAIGIAIKAHQGQTARDGTPFIDHPLRLMNAAQGEDQQIVAVLHDVVERSDWTVDALREAGLQPDLATAIDALSRRSGEDYSDFVIRAAANPLARSVKILDLEDKVNVGRGSETVAEHSIRLARYLDALICLRA